MFSAPLPQISQEKHGNEIKNGDFVEKSRIRIIFNIVSKRSNDLENKEFQIIGFGNAP